jgi:hypothetical protein
MLTVQDVANVRRVGRVAAYRWLLRNASRYLKRRGRFVVISAKDYRRLDNPPMDDRVAARLVAIESRIADAEARLDVQHKALRNLHAV